MKGTPQKYQVLPREVEAMQFLGTNNREVGEWLGLHLMVTINAVFRPNGNVPQDYKITVPCVGTAAHGDYIVKNQNSSVSIIPAAVFELTHTQVNHEPT